MKPASIRVSREQVRRLWLLKQGLTDPRSRTLTLAAFRRHLSQTGGLQMDSVNVVDRAHYLTLWSRFGAFDRGRLDRWAWGGKEAHEFWGHVASLLPLSALPLSRRYMRDFNPVNNQWWMQRKPEDAVLRRVLGRIRREGPLESADFRNPAEPAGPWWGWKAEKMALEWLWRRGRIAIRSRRHFRRVFDLASRVYPPGRAASRRDYEDSWLITGLRGNGVAPARHLRDYWTTPRLSAVEKREVIARCLRSGSVAQVEVEGETDPWYALPDDLSALSDLPKPRGTTLVCPFDSFLWQRDRAEELLDFRYRIEIYVPAPKRVFGYYVLPIMHQGRLVGRLDPKLDRSTGTLHIRAIFTEKSFRPDAEFKKGLGASLTDLAVFLGADSIDLPRRWRSLV